MEDREHVCDAWLQKPATVPSATDILEAKRMLHIICARDELRPPQCISLLQAFKTDNEIKQKAEGMIASSFPDLPTREQIVLRRFQQSLTTMPPDFVLEMEQDPNRYNALLCAYGNTRSVRREVTREIREQMKAFAKAKAKFISDLYEKFKLQPGSLDRFYNIVEDDRMRFAREMKICQQELFPEFDSNNGLLPVQGPVRPNSAS